MSLTHGGQCINTNVGLASRETATRVEHVDGVFDGLTFLYFRTRGRDEELINLMQLLLVKVSLAAPRRARNALSVENEREVIVGTWKQARHSILANSFQGPGWRLQILQYLAAYILINRLYRIAVCGEPLSGTLRPASAVFFSSPASRSSYESRCRNAA